MTEMDLKGSPLETAQHRCWKHSVWGSDWGYENSLFPAGSMLAWISSFFSTYHHSTDLCYLDGKLFQSLAVFLFCVCMVLGITVLQPTTGSKHIINKGKKKTANVFWKVECAQSLLLYTTLRKNRKLEFFWNQTQGDILGLQMWRWALLSKERRTNTVKRGSSPPLAPT